VSFLFISIRDIVPPNFSFFQLSFEFPYFCWLQLDSFWNVPVPVLLPKQLHHLSTLFFKLFAGPAENPRRWRTTGAAFVQGNNEQCCGAGGAATFCLSRSWSFFGPALEPGM
jgi:hypothetical protein